MKYYIGADLGTSALKLLLTDSHGSIVKITSRSYDLHYPAPGWSEQSPQDWWDALVDGIADLTANIDRSAVAGIGTAGQMHGLVVLDDGDEVIRPAILWNDGRTSAETDELNTVIGKEKLSELTANIAFAGFTAPKILWMRKNEPEKFAAIAKIMLPKDYLAYRLTGVHSCDYSDAAGTLLLDVEHKCYSKQMLDYCGVTEEQMPSLYESGAIIGTLLPEIAEKLSLSADTFVVAGAGDNAAAAVGTGTVGNGRCNISLGTSGTIFISSDSFSVDPVGTVHSFCHADGGFHLMGCILSAASCNKWFCGDILGTEDYSSEQSSITDDDLGRNHVYFLPYLMGERSPINDTDARGTFIGMRLDTSRREMVQAVLEGVAFAIRDNLEVARSLGVKIERSTLCGGGAKSKLWQKIICNALGIELDIPVLEEGPGLGAAMFAMTAGGEYASIEECASDIVKIRESISPDPEIAARYDEQYAKFRRIYPTLKGLYKELK